MSLKEGRKGGRKEELELASFVWKSPARARARGRNAPIYSLHETGQQKLTIITQCGTGLVEEEGGLFLDSQPIVGPNQAGLFLDATVGPDQTEGRLFLVTVGGTKPRWAFLGQLCGTGPNQTQKKVGFSWTPLWNRQRKTRPDQTRPDKSKADAGEVGFSSTPSWNRPRQTRPDKPKADAGGGGLFFDALAEPDHARPDQTRQNQIRRGRKVGFSWTPLWNQTTPDQTRPDKPKADAGGRWAFLGRPCGTRPDQARPDQK